MRKTYTTPLTMVYGNQSAEIMAASSSSKSETNINVGPGGVISPTHSHGHATDEQYAKDSFFGDFDDEVDIFKADSIMH